MAAFAGLVNHQMTAGQALTGQGANPMAAQATGMAETSGTSSSSSSSSSSATISANDFLTLLVTEMQNQDPTAQTDPNEYIDQLVQVNSLEQLIDINQNLSQVLGTASSSTSSPASGSAQPGVAGARPAGATAPGAAAAHSAGTHAAPPAGGASRTGSGAAGSNTVAAISQFAQSVGAKRAPGNLSVPAAQPAAHRVAHALDGKAHASPTPGNMHGAMNPI